MTKGDSFVPIVMAAAELRRGSADRYEALVKSVRAHAERAKADLLAAGHDGLLWSQGRAQALDQLAYKLENCITLDEQYRARK